MLNALLNNSLMSPLTGFFLRREPWALLLHGYTQVASPRSASAREEGLVLIPSHPIFDGKLLDSEIIFEGVALGDRHLLSPFTLGWLLLWFPTDFLLMPGRSGRPKGRLRPSWICWGRSRLWLILTPSFPFPMVVP